MKQYSTIRPDGTKRYRNGIIPSYVPHPKQRARVTNDGRPLYDKRTAQARRIDDLMRDHLRDFSSPSEAALGLARAASIAAVKVERFEAMEARGEPVDDAMFVRVAGQLSRAITALRMLKPEAAAQAKAASEGALNLRRHLEELAAKGKAAAPAAEAE